MEQRGDFAAALHWYDLAIGMLDPERLAAIGTRGNHSIDGVMLFGRQRCRQSLGLPADDLDRAADVAELNRLDFVRQFERSAAAQARLRPGVVRMLVWQRDPQRKAAKRWPDVFVPSVIGNQADVEDHLQSLRRDQGFSEFVLVPGNVDEFARYLERTGGDPADEEVRLAYSAEAAEQGRRTSWPPRRNDPCWCGLQRKYKKCCAAPAPPRAELSGLGASHARVPA